MGEIYPDITVEVEISHHDDRKFLAVAFISGAEYLITGDKHLLELNNFQKTKILTPREFLDKLYSAKSCAVRPL